MYVFIETRLFTRLVDEYFSDAEYAELQLFLMNNYAKNEAESLSGPVLKKIKEEIDGSS